MKAVKYLVAIIVMAGALVSCGTDSGQPRYKDASLSVEKRVNDLLSRMTLEEKVGQMNQFVGIEHIRASEAHLTEEELRTNTAAAYYPGFPADTIERWTKEGLIGSFLHVLTVEEANYLQDLAMQSRLQIPIMFGIDAIHGNCNCPDNTAYPTSIGLASSFNTDMAYTIARQTAAEMRAMNMHWTFNPNVEVARDARWGRCGETFGEDPYLVSRMGEESVKGYQGDMNSDDVLACIKHFVGGSQPINGTNGSPTDLSERTLREVFFPPFRKGVEAGALSLMTAHNELNGIPCHSNEWIMRDVLRGEWGYEHFVMSDWWPRLPSLSGDDWQNYYLAKMVKAQNDVYMCQPDSTTFNDDMQEAFESGYLTLGELQRCAKNIVKFSMSTLAFRQDRKIDTDTLDSCEELVYEHSLSDEPMLPYELPESRYGNKPRQRVIAELAYEGFYCAEIIYNTDGDALEQRNITIYVNASEPTCLTVSGTDGKDESRRFKMYLDQNPTMFFEGDGLLSFRLYKLN